MICVVSQQGEVLMPTARKAKVRKWLNSGKAKIISHAPFTIQLLFDTGCDVQEVTLGIDSGYAMVGFSVVTEKKELLGGELTLLGGIKNRLEAKARYRRTRRNRLRYRQARFFKDSKPEGWLSPSIQHKLDSHINFINSIKACLPITEVIIEVANFDIQKIKTANISGKEYQEGEQKGFSDLREYIFHRDQHECQSPKCIAKRKQKEGNAKQNKQIILEVHHLGYWMNDSSNRPSNLVTLCTGCHTSDQHQKNGLLFGWKPKLKTFREATFMTMVRWRLVNQLNGEHTYGTETKFKRSELKLKKSHHNDAFVIANGTNQQRSPLISIIQRRKNNRSLEKFYDAQYLDLRDSKKRSGKVLCSQRRKRNRENLPDSLRQYRGHKISKGRVAIRTERSLIQPKDIVMYQGKRYHAIGMQNKGAYLKMTNGTNTMVKNMKYIDIIFHQKSLIYA
jgi:hypothetical protein